MVTDDIVRFNQVRNYKQCITDAMKMIVHLPKNIVRTFCFLWGLSSILAIILLYTTIFFSEQIIGMIIGSIIFLGILWIQATSLGVQSYYIYGLSQNHETRCSLDVLSLLKKVLNWSPVYFLLRFCQVVFFIILSMGMENLHISYSYIVVTCVIFFIIITYIDFYLLSDMFLRHTSMVKSFRSICSCGPKSISNSLVIYVSMVFLLGISVVFMFMPTFILSCNMGANRFAIQIGDTSVMLPLWIHILNTIFTICIFIIINFLLTTCRFAATLFWNTKLIFQKEKREMLNS